MSILKKLALADIIQEANIAMMHALDKFDYKKDIKFSTYATIWINQHIDRVLANANRAMSVPCHMNKTIGRVQVIRRKLADALEREPSVEEIIAADTSKRKTHKLTPALVRDALHYDMVTYDYSLSRVVSEGDDSNPVTLLDFIDSQQDPLDAGVVEDVIDTLERQTMALLLRTLPEREADILANRYGLITGDPILVKELAIKWGISNTRVQQLEASALEMLRDRMLAHTSNANCQ